MKTLKSFVSYVKGTTPRGRVYGDCIYHDSNNSSAIYTNGMFMIISKDCYKEELKNTCELFYKKSEKDSDWSNFKYEKCIPNDLKEVDFNKFLSALNLVCENLYQDKSYKENCDETVYFEEFGFTLSMSMIHIVKMFVDCEKKNELKLFITDKIEKAIVIKSCDFFGNEINRLIFMPIVYNVNHKIEPNFIVNENTYRNAEDFVIRENIEKEYSWSDMANDLTSKGIPHEVVGKIADVEYAWILKRPVFSIIKFDNYLHQRFGDYESEGKSMKDLFKILFGDSWKRIAYYFGIN